MRSVVVTLACLVLVACRKPTPRPGDFAEFDWHTTLSVPINEHCGDKECRNDGWTKTEYHSLVRFDVVAVDEGSISEVISVRPHAGEQQPLHDVLRRGLQVRLETTGTLTSPPARDESPHEVRLAEGPVRCDFIDDGCVVKRRAPATQGSVQWAPSSTHVLSLVREGHEAVAPPLTGTPIFVAGQWVDDDVVMNGHHRRLQRTWGSKAGAIVVTTQSPDGTFERSTRLLPHVGQLLASSFDGLRAAGAPVKWRGLDARSDGVHVRMAPEQALPTGMPLEVFVGWLWTAPRPGGYATGEVLDWAGAPDASGERDE